MGLQHPSSLCLQMLRQSVGITGSHPTCDLYGFLLNDTLGTSVEYDVQRPLPARSNPTSGDGLTLGTARDDLGLGCRAVTSRETV